MRLTEQQRQVIRSVAAKHFGVEARVRLFGSRVDDSRRGGDIDLYIMTALHEPAEIVRAELAFLAELKVKLGDQKIDVLVDYPTRSKRPPIFDIAAATGVDL